MIKEKLDKNKLKENILKIGNPLSTKGLLFHGTTIKNLNKICEDGIISQEYGLKRYGEKFKQSLGQETQSYYGYNLVSIYNPWFYSENGWFFKGTDKETNLADIVSDFNLKEKHEIFKTNQKDVMSKLNKIIELRKISFRKPNFYFVNEDYPYNEISLIISNKVKTLNFPGWYEYEAFVKNKIESPQILGIFSKSKHINNPTLLKLSKNYNFPIYNSNGELE